MLVALVFLNGLYLICSLLFNAEVLNTERADISLKKLEILETFSQILAATNMCLLVWRLCYRRYRGKGRVSGSRLPLRLCLSLRPLGCSKVQPPDWIAEQFSGSLRVSSLYTYVTKTPVTLD